MLNPLLLLSVDTAMTVICPLLIGIILLAFLWSLIVATKDGVKYLQKLHQIPCDRCQYYTGTHYLKCPVHPMTALSEDAIGCRSFESITGCQTQLCDRPSANKRSRYVG